MVEILVPKFYDAQAEVLNSVKKFQTVVAGRRAGKTFTVHWGIIFKTLGYRYPLSQQSPQTVVAALPTLKQAKPIMWEPLVSLFENDLAPFCLKIDRSRNIIYPHILGTPKPPILVAGANDQNGDRLRGLRIYYLAADEFQDWKPDVFNLIVRPAMADTPGSSALFTGTPKGRLNGLFQMFAMADKFPDTYKSYQLRSIDNPFGMSLSEIENMRLTLPPRQFRQEVEGSFEDFEGKIFSEFTEENIISEIPSSRVRGTYVGIDWGDINPAIVVWQAIEDLWILREAWVGNFSKKSRQGNPVTMVTIKQEALRLAEKWDATYCFCDPSRPANTLEMRGVGQVHRQMGLARASDGYNPVQEGIDYLHKMMFQKRLLIAKDMPCNNPNSPSSQDVYDLFTAYHRQIDRDGMVTEQVAPGQVDDIIDASRYALVPILASPDRVLRDT